MAPTSIIIIRHTPAQAQRRNPKRAEIKHACEDLADRALAVLNGGHPEHQPTAKRLVRDAINQDIGVRATAATQSASSEIQQAAEAVFKGRAA